VAVRITSLVNYLLNVPGPIEVLFEPRQRLTFEFIEYDSVINDERIWELMQEERILVEDLEPSAGTTFTDKWNLEPKLRLGPYVFWVDALGQLRMKPSNPTFDLDGVVIGPGGGITPHGATHEFNGSDPVPRIEVLEGAWTCTVTEQVGDAVFENVANSVRQADASTIAKMPVIGIIISKPTASSCIIARSGEVTLAGLTVGQEYYASTTPGQLTTTVPTASGEVAQYVEYARNTTTLVVQLRDPVVRA
jgi:hypothetical protein